jgi:hypothetical protein
MPAPAGHRAGTVKETGAVTSAVHPHVDQEVRRSLLKQGMYLIIREYVRLQILQLFLNCQVV